MMLSPPKLFNQSCYITHGKCVRQQHYFSVGLYVRLSITLSPPKPLDGTKPNLLHYFPSQGCVRATLFFHASGICQSVYRAISS